MPAITPILQSTKALERFLIHIQDAGIPPKVNSPYLKSVGFKSGNDAALVPTLKALGFIDSAGVPTDTWKQYRNKTLAPKVLGQAIRECYSGLFEIYQDANRKDNEAIANWIRTATGFAGVTVDRAVRTFKALVSHAEFVDEAVDTSTAPKEGITPSAGAPQQIISLPSATSGGPSVNINVELHLPSSSDPKIYENFFKAMKEYLLEGSK